MGIEVLTRGAKRSYEQFYAQEQNGVDKVLFSTPDVDTSGAFMIDRFIQSPFGIAYRDKNNQSHVRHYQPGTGYVYDVPRASEKTPLDEDLKDAAITGLDPSDPASAHIRKLMDDVVKDHVTGHNMTKWKQALDVIFDAVFYAKGVNGEDIGLNIDFSRASANELTHDFTATDTIPIAFREMQEQLIAQGAPLSNQVIIVGSSWLSQWSSNSDVQAYLDSNAANMLLRQEMMPPQLQGAHGLRVVGVYRDPQMIAPVYVAVFQPGTPYYEYKGATASDWVDATKAAMFSLDSQMYRVLRGVEAFDETGTPRRVVDDVVFDTYHENDPIVDFMRSQSRHCFVPGNIDHTVVSTGTFA